MKKYKKFNLDALSHSDSWSCSRLKSYFALYSFFFLVLILIGNNNEKAQKIEFI